MKNRVLVIGIYLTDHPNYARQITEDLRKAKDWSVDICWVSLGKRRIPRSLKKFTLISSIDFQPKFHLLNQLLSKIIISDYNYLIVVDDDIELPSGFIDQYLWIQKQLDFSLTQPARTSDSFIDHAFVMQHQNIAARRTRFVEVGPLFSIRYDTFPLILPFDERSPMGWGLDYVWPVILERACFRLGIIDAFPVRHKLRKPVSFYDYHDTAYSMRDYLSKVPHLSPEEAFTVIETYPMSNCPLNKN